MLESPRSEPVSLGSGPVEQLALRHLRGELDLATACRMAQHPSVSAALDDEYVRMIGSFAFDQATSNRVAPGRVLMRIMLAATDALPDDEDNHFMKSTSELNWVNGISVCMYSSPNWDDFASATAVADKALARAHSTDDRLLEYSLLRALGSLSMDSLVAHQPDYLAWKARWDDWYERGNRASSSGSFPPPEQALQAAHDYFMRAADLYDDAHRGRALKGCVQALEWLSRADGQRRDDGIRKLAGEALLLLDAMEDLPSITYLIGVLRDTEEGATEWLRSLADTDCEALAERVGPVSATVTLSNLVALLRTEDHELALDLAARADPIAESTGDPKLISTLMNNWLIALGDSLFEEELDNSAGTLVASQQIAQRGQQEDWPLPRLAGALLKLAIHCGMRDEELEGLQLMKAAEPLAPDVFARHQRPLDALRQTLWGGAGAVAFNRREHLQAAHCYGNAILFALAMHNDTVCLKFLEYMLDACMHVGEDHLQDLLTMIYALGPRVEAQLGAEGTIRMQRFGQVLTQVQCRSTVNSELLHLTWQVSKASRFSAALATHAGPGLPADEVSVDLLKQISVLRELVPLANEGIRSATRIDRELRLLAFVNDEIPSGGTTPSARLSNLQHRFDQRLDRRMLTPENPGVLEPYLLSDIQDVLDERTVLLNMYLGPFEEGQARYALIAARNYVNAHAVPDESGLLVELRDDVRRETAYSMALPAFAWRESLAAEVADTDAFDDGASWGRTFVLGGLDAILSDLAQRGCDHLCILPHGPLHYLPLQLLPAGNGILADHWTVTALPSTELLRRRNAGASRSGLSAFGVTFADDNPFNLDPMPEAGDEACRIAKAFGAEAILDGAATEHAVRSALTTSRYVHIATHGAINLEAPAFQYLVLTPTSDSDGILYAHELLDCDLRGLELVTLSACETALGRFDRGDNPRGLPAMLLLAGAETVIGTLWTVNSAVARAFFVHLYARLAAGDSRRQAFRAAQLEARRRFPKPQDWAAFYYLGT
ncbi:hypothetical protein BH23GEM9_BH23GEM9_32120 [soil metagenome]